MDTVTEPTTAIVDPRPGTLADEYGVLLYLSDQDRRGLTWTKTRARMWLTALKRRRRYGMPRGAAYTPEESEVIEALAGLEREAGRLLEMAGVYPSPESATGAMS